MSFEKDFPSIKEFQVWTPNGTPNPVIDLDNVEEHCLDKQRVKNIIDEWIENFDKRISMIVDRDGNVRDFCSTNRRMRDWKFILLKLREELGL